MYRTAKKLKGTEMINEESISDKILSLPFGVILAATLCFVLVSTALLIAVSIMLKVNASLLLISLITGFTVVRLIYFGLTGK